MHFWKQLVDALTPDLIGAIKVALVGIVAAAGAYVRTFLQRKAADIAVAEASAQGFSNHEKKAIASDKLAAANPFVRPLGEANLSAAIEGAHRRAQSSTPPPPEAPKP